MKFLNDHIKNQQFKNVYLIYGEERYLVSQYKERLREAIIGDDTMNYSYYEGRKIDINSLIDTCDTMPFFAERRLVIVEDSGFFKSANDKLNDYLKQLPEYLHILFVESEVDKRNKVYKTVNEVGYVSVMDLQDHATLSRWIVGLLKNDGKAITGKALELLLEKAGQEMSYIRSEVEKLVCYCMDKDHIDEQDVEQVCVTRTANRIFDMITAIALHKQKQALELYYDLLLLKEPPMRILALIVRQFNMLMQVKELQKQQLDNKTIASKMGVAPFVVGKYMTQAKSFTSGQLRDALNDMAGMEEAVKTGNMKDVTAVELIIIKYSNKETN